MKFRPLLLLILSAATFTTTASEDIGIEHAAAKMALARGDFIAFKNQCSKKIQNIEVLDSPRIFYAAYLHKQMENALGSLTRRMRWGLNGEELQESNVAKYAKELQGSSAIYAALVMNHMTNESLLPFDKESKNYLADARCNADSFLYRALVDYVLSNRLQPK